MKFRLIAAFVPALISFVVSAQSPANHAFAITSDSMGRQNWTEVKQIDLATGSVTSNIYESSRETYDVFDGRSSKKITITPSDSANSDKRPFSGLSAACAYDKKSNRLYYAPLFINQLRYIDLSTPTPSVYIFQNEPFSTASTVDAEANQVTRMVIAADGNGYALNNDGSHFVKFTTGNMPVVTDLGSVHDAPENDSISVSDANTSWGGDMVADASGNLYLITSHNFVFKIDVQTRTALFVKVITGLPEGYTTNGSVVDGDGSLVLNSANSVNGYYRVDPSTWVAKIIVTDGQVYNTSDLANENLLFRSTLAPAKEEVVETMGIYPNPVKSNTFKVSFTNKPSGEYNVTLVDLAGRTVSDKVVNVQNAGHVAEVKISPTLARGLYMVKVSNRDNKEIFSRKLIVE